MNTLFKDHGIGVGLRPPHYPLFLNRKPDSVSWVEVISENFMDWELGRALQALRQLEQVRRHVPVMLHGVSLSLGSVDPLSKSYLRRLRNLCRRIEPEWISDHLCWTGVDGENLHDLLPLPYTEETIKLVTRNIIEVQDWLGRRILIENVSSYAESEHSEMTEWVFLAEIARRADCGILLDVNNVYVSAFNHGFDPLEYLKAVPADRVGQIHLAGHTNNGTHLVDTHDEPVCDAVWDLYRWVVNHFPPVSAMIERDANIPEWKVLEAELLKAKEIRQKESEEGYETNIASRISAAL